MSWLSRLERRLAPFVIPNLTLILIAGQVVVFLLSLFKPEVIDLLVLRPQAVLRGELWRLVAFPFVSELSLLFWIFELMLLHLMGNALEATWGSVRYNLFFWIGYLSAVGFAMLLGVFAPEGAVASSMFIYGSIFLAFAYLFPDFELMLFFILPVKVKYLAVLQLLGYAATLAFGLSTFAAGGWLTCVMLLASNLNLLLFFSREWVQKFRSRSTRIKMRFEEVRAAGIPRHTCAVCGATNLSHPDREFRYCTECEGTPAYCNEHLVGHKHRTTATS